MRCEFGFRMRAIHLNHLLSVVLLLILFGFVSFQIMESDVKGNVRGMAFPMLVFIFSFFLFVTEYREEEGKLAAFVIGFLILIPEFGRLIANMQYSEPVIGSSWFNWLRMYIGGSHILYGASDGKELLKSLGQRVQ